MKKHLLLYSLILLFQAHLIGQTTVPKVIDNGQDQIIADIDQDQVLDTVYINYQQDDAQLVCKLSSKDFQKDASHFIINTGKDCHFTAYLEDANILFCNHKSYVERTIAYLKYDPTTRNVVLVGMARSQDGDNDINGAGSSFLDIANQTYTGEWSYYDYFDDNPEEYRIYMPEIKTQMDFPKINLSELSTNTFTTYNEKCFQLYQNQLKSIFPNGNNSRNGALMVDLDDDYDIDSVYFDAYDFRIKTQMYNYDTEDMDEIASIPIDFDDVEYEIKEESKGHYVIIGSTDGRKVNFSYDAISQKFIVDGMAQKNWIHKDLDGDGIVDSMKIYWNDGNAIIGYQLSTQGFSEVRSPEYIANNVVVEETPQGVKVGLGFSRSELTSTYRFNPNSQSMQLIGLDFWEMYSHFSYNLLNGDFIGTNEVYEDDGEEKTTSFKTKMDFPFTDFESFDDEKIMEFMEKSFQKRNQSMLQKQLRMEIENGFNIGYFTISPESSEEIIDLGDVSYLNCELSLQITDSSGKVQQFFIDNVDLEEKIILLYDDNIKFNKDLGYYIHEETPILPKNLPDGKYEIRVILSHQDFDDDIIGGEVEIELPLELVDE